MNILITLTFILIVSGCNVLGEKTTFSSDFFSKNYNEKFINYSTSKWTTNGAIFPEIKWSYDDETIAYFEIGLGTSLGASDIFPMTNIGPVNSYTITGLGLTECVPYYVTLKAYSSSGELIDNNNSLEAGMYDSTSPTALSGISNAQDATTNESEYHYWTSGVDTCSQANTHMAISTNATEGGIISNGYSSLGNVSEGRISSGITLLAGTDYYTLLKSVDDAGNETAFAAFGPWQTIHPPSLIIKGNQTTTDSEMNPSTSSKLEFNSFSSLSSAYFSHSTSSSPENITINLPGYYFTSLSMPLKVSGSAPRSVPKSSLYINATESSNSISNSAHIRDTNNQTDSSNSFATVENLSATDLLKIENIATTTNLNNIVSDNEYTFYSEYIHSSRDILLAEGVDNVSGSDLNSATAQAIKWTTQNSYTNTFTHSGGSHQDITITKPGNYMLFVNIPLETSLTNRTAPQLDIKYNGSKISGGTAAQGYIRGTNNNFSSSLHWSGLIHIPSGQENSTLNLETYAGTSTTGVVDVGTKKMSFFLEKIHDNKRQIHLSSTSTVAGPNFNQTSSIAWSTNILKDSNYFSHSTGSNNDKIYFSKPGKYLVVYNDHLTSAITRANVKITIKLNGSQVPGAKCSSHYIRNSSAHDESSCSLVHPIEVLAGDYITIDTEQEAAAGAVTAASEAIISILKK